MPSPPQPLFGIGQHVAVAQVVAGEATYLLGTIRDCYAVAGAARYQVALDGRAAAWYNEDELTEAYVQGELPLDAPPD